MYFPDNNREKFETCGGDEYTYFERICPRYVTALASTAHTYGNVLATAQRWCLNVFGTQYDRPNESIFKSIHVSSQIAHSQILSVPGRIKKSKPMIAFSPRVDYGEDVFMKGTLLTHRRGGQFTTGTHGVVDLNPFFYDGERKLSMYYTRTRRCMHLDILATFDTEIEQMNYMDYLLNGLDWDTPFDMNVWLEAYLSTEIMEMLSDIAQVPIHSPVDNTVTDFLNYMNSNSVDPVAYKIAGETGNEEFYRYYHTNIISTLSNLDKNTGEVVNHIRTNFTITFSLRLEFWAPGLLYLMSDAITKNQSFLPKDATIVPICADVFYLNDLNLSPGWQVYGHTSYILEKKNDSVDYSDLIQERVRRIIRYHVSNGIPLVNFLDVKVRKMGYLQIEGRDYTVDYVKNIIFFNNEEWGFSTYTIVVVVNTLYINDMINNIADSDV